MAWKLTVAGVDKTAQIKTEPQPRIDLGPLNGRARAFFTCIPGYIPARLAEVVIYKTDGVTPLFGGIILKRSGNGLLPQVQTQTVIPVECSDFFTYLDWSYLTLTYSSTVTLKSVLTDIVAALPASYAITLDAGQVDGPTLAAFSWVNKRASDAVRELSDRSGYVAAMSPTKALSMFVPGTDSAPFSLTTAVPHCSELSWDDPDDAPVNTVLLVCGPNGVGTTKITQTWVSTAATTYSLQGVNVPASAEWPGIVTIATVQYPIWPAGQGGANDIEWDFATDDGTLTFKGTSSALISPPGVSIVLEYFPQYPFTVEATSAASPEIQMLARNEDIVTYAAAVEAAAGVLAQLNQSPRQITVDSFEHGWEPGQALSVAMTRVTGSFTITDVSASLMAVAPPLSELWAYRVQALESTVYQGSYLDRWRAITGGGSSSGIVVTGGGGGTSGTVGRSIYFLGGTGLDATQSPTPTWVPASGGSTTLGTSPFQVTIDTDLRGTMAATITARLRAAGAGVSVQARLYNVTDNTACTGTSGVVTSTNWTTVTFGVALTSGAKAYELQLLPGAANADVFAAGGYLE